MDLATLKDMILNSCVDDWIAYDELGTYVLKSDLLVSIQDVRSDELEPFYEDWAVNYPDKNAYQKKFFVKYGENVVEIVNAASIDGGRAVIPWPDFETKVISKFYNKIGEIVNLDLNRYYEYVHRSGLSVEE